jgi:hypothetical protein
MIKILPVSKMAVLHVSSTVVISSIHFLENKSGTSPPPVHGCLLEVGGRSWTHVPVTVHGCLLEVCGPSIRIDACLYHVHTTKDNPSSWHEASKGKCNEEESIQMPQEATVVTPPQKEIQQQWHPRSSPLLEGSARPRSAPGVRRHRDPTASGRRPATAVRLRAALACVQTPSGNIFQSIPDIVRRPDSL